MDYVAPKEVEDAVRTARGAVGSVRFLNGGTDVLVQLRSGMHRPDLIVDVKHLPGMTEVSRQSDGSWNIGAAVPGMMLGRDHDLRNDWPGVVEALELIGSTQIQGRATLVGNLCNGSPAADSVPPLFTAGATVTVAGEGKTRRVPVSEIPVAPGKTSLEPWEVITCIHLPSRRKGGADAYLRFIPRTEMDIAVVGCSVRLRLEEGTVAEASVALGAVAPTVRSVPDAAAALVGSKLEEPALDALARACSDACQPIDDKRGTIEFRTKVAGVLARRAARIAYERGNRNQ